MNVPIGNIVLGDIQKKINLLEKSLTREMRVSNRYLPASLPYG